MYNEDEHQRGFRSGWPTEPELVIVGKTNQDGFGELYFVSVEFHWSVFSDAPQQEQLISQLKLQQRGEGMCAPCNKHT